MQTMPERSKIAIVGAGLIGSGWALVVAVSMYQHIGNFVVLETLANRYLRMIK